MPDIKQTLNSWIDYSSPKLGTFLARMWNDQKRAITYKELREAIMNGQLDLKWLEQWRQDYSKFIVSAYAPLAQQAIDNSAKALQTQFGIGAQSLTFPYLDNFISTQGGKLIREVSQEQFTAINTLVRQATMSETMDVKELAKAIRPTVGLTRRQAQAAYHRYEQARKDGYSEPEAREKQAAYAERLHRQRAETISITEMAYAYNYGEQAYMQQCMKDGLIGNADKKWVTAFDERVCSICGNMDGEVVALNDRFSIGVLLPPAHPRCRCVVSYINVMQPRDWVDPNPPDKVLGETAYGYAQERRDEMAYLVEHADTPEITELWQQHVSELKSVKQDTPLIGGKDTQHGAHYDYRDKHVHLYIADSIEGKSYANPHTLHFHEYMHNIDYLLGEQVYGAKDEPYSLHYVHPEIKLGLYNIAMNDSRRLLESYYQANMAAALSNVFDDAVKSPAMNGGLGLEEICRGWVTEWLEASDISIKSAYGRRALLKFNLATRSRLDDALINYFTDQLPEIGRGVFDRAILIKNRFGQSSLVKTFSKTIGSLYKEKERCDIAELFEPYALTYGVEYPFGFGHGARFHESLRTTEIMASIGSASISQKESLSLIKRYFPTTYKAFMDMIRSVL